MDMNWYTPEPSTSEGSAETNVAPTTNNTNIPTTTTSPPPKESHSSCTEIPNPFDDVDTLEDTGSSDFTLNEGCGCASGCGCKN